MSGSWPIINCQLLIINYQLPSSPHVSQIGFWLARPALGSLGSVMGLSGSIVGPFSPLTSSKPCITFVRRGKTISVSGFLYVLIFSLSRLFDNYLAAVHHINALLRGLAVELASIKGEPTGAGLVAGGDALLYAGDALFKLYADGVGACTRAHHRGRNLQVGPVGLQVVGAGLRSEASIRRVGGIEHEVGHTALGGLDGGGLGSAHEHVHVIGIRLTARHIVGAWRTFQEETCACRRILHGLYDDVARRAVVACGDICLEVGHGAEVEVIGGAVGGHAHIRDGDAHLRGQDGERALLDGDIVVVGGRRQRDVVDAWCVAIGGGAGEDGVEHRLCLTVLQSGVGGVEGGQGVSLVDGVAVHLGGERSLGDGERAVHEDKSGIRRRALRDADGIGAGGGSGIGCTGDGGVAIQRLSTCVLECGVLLAILTGVAVGGHHRGLRHFQYGSEFAPRGCCAIGIVSLVGDDECGVLDFGITESIAYGSRHRSGMTGNELKEFTIRECSI